MNKHTGSNDAQSLMLRLGGTPIDPQPPQGMLLLEEALKTVRLTPEYEELLARRRRDELTSEECFKLIVDLCIAHYERTG